LPVHGGKIALASLVQYIPWNGQPQITAMRVREVDVRNIVSFEMGDDAFKKPTSCKWRTFQVSTAKQK
jgi:hypothetical protein